MKRRKCLVDRSHTAGEYGGAKAIRKFPKCQRLWISARIAKELGKDRAAKKCAVQAFQKYMEKGDDLAAEEIVGQFGLTEHIKEVKSKRIEYYVKKDVYFHAAMIAKEHGLVEHFKKTALKRFEERLQGMLDKIDGYNEKKDVREKRKYLEATAQVLLENQKEKEKYKVEVLGKQFMVHPDVFSPKYFNDTEFFAKELPINADDEFLEIGCGTGVVSISAVWKGASRVVAVDINPAAVENAKENVKLHGLEDKITVMQGDVFEPLKDGKFDTIFWNVPFGYVKRENLTILEKAAFDSGYRSIRKFIEEAGKHLKPNGRLLIGFSSTLGHLKILKELLAEAGYGTKLVKETKSAEIHPVKFQIFEAIRTSP